jgi:hypothetical protein
VGRGSPGRAPRRPHARARSCRRPLACTDPASTRHASARYGSTRRASTRRGPTLRGPTPPGAHALCAGQPGGDRAAGPCPSPGRLVAAAARRCGAARSRGARGGFGSRSYDGSLWHRHPRRSWSLRRGRMQRATVISVTWPASASRPTHSRAITA